MAKTKVTLRYPTVGKKAGDVIEVEKEQADALVANGSAVPTKDATPSDPKK